MFRVLTKAVPQPSLLLLCDNRNCFSHRLVAINPASMTTADGAEHEQQLFIEAAKIEGWLVGLDRQLCYECHEAIKAAVKAKQMIHAPTPEQKRAVEASKLITVSR